MSYRYMVIRKSNKSYDVCIYGETLKSEAENSNLRLAIDKAVDEFSEKRVIVPYISESKLCQIIAELERYGDWFCGLE